MALRREDAQRHEDMTETNRALLVIDMLRDFIDPDGALSLGAAGREIIPAVSERLERARRRGDLVVFICDRHRPDDAEFEMFPPHCIVGTPGADIVSELQPEGGEAVVTKRRYSGFYGTELDILLREKSISGVELAGVCTNICVLYTAADARNRGYHVRVAPRAVAGLAQEAHDWALAEMEGTLGCELICEDD